MSFPPISIRPVIVALLLSSGSCMTDTKACYGWSGSNWTDSQVSDLFPCEPSSETSACCHVDDVCYSNSLCVPASQQPASSEFFYNGCTDPSGANSTVCLPYCQDFPSSRLQPCGSETYCCYGDGGCDCEDDMEVFTVLTGFVVGTVILSTTTLTKSIGDQFMSALATATATMTASTSILFGTPSASASTSAATTTNAADSIDAAKMIRQRDMSFVAIGVGLGVGVCSIIVVLVGFLVWRIQSRTRRPVSSVSVRERIIEKDAIETAMHEVDARAQAVHEMGDVAEETTEPQRPRSFVR